MYENLYAMATQVIYFFVGFLALFLCIILASPSIVSIAKLYDSLFRERSIYIVMKVNLTREKMGGYVVYKRKDYYVCSCGTKGELEKVSAKLYCDIPIVQNNQTIPNTGAYAIYVKS